MTPPSSLLSLFSVSRHSKLRRGGTPALFAMGRALGVLGTAFALCTGIVIGSMTGMGGGLAAGRESPRVAASIRPVHSLVAGVMAGVGAPDLLARRGGSPHGQALRPSAARMLSKATLVFWIGGEMETSLVKPLQTLAANATVVTLSRAEGISLLGFRKAGMDAGKSRAGTTGTGLSEDREHAAGHGGYNPHIWLDPRHGAAMVREIARALAREDPHRAAVYRRNGDRLTGRLGALEKELEILLAPVARRPFVAYHGAYAYFERRFGLNGLGTVTENPERPPGARRVVAIRRGLRQGRAVCLVREPWTPQRRVAMLLENTAVRVGVLDPLGTKLEPGSGLYFNLLRSLARGFAACLRD